MGSWIKRKLYKQADHHKYVSAEVMRGVSCLDCEQFRTGSCLFGSVIIQKLWKDLHERFGKRGDLPNLKVTFRVGRIIAVGKIWHKFK